MAGSCWGAILQQSKIDCSTIVDLLTAVHRGHVRLTIDEQGLLIAEVSSPLIHSATKKPRQQC